MPGIQALALALSSSLLVGVTQWWLFGSTAISPSLEHFLCQAAGGVIGGQIAVLALWLCWSSASVWKRAMVVLGWFAIPMYLASFIEWWLGISLTDFISTYPADALLLLVLAAVLLPLRWFVACRLSYSACGGESIGNGRFRLVELFGLTLVVAGALAILVNGGERPDNKEILLQGILLALLVLAIMGVLLPSLRAVYSSNKLAMWHLAFLAWLLLIIPVTAELFCQIMRLFHGSPIAMQMWLLRFTFYVIGAGFSLSVFASLWLLRVAGMRLTGVAAAQSRATDAASSPAVA